MLIQKLKDRVGTFMVIFALLFTFMLTLILAIFVSNYLAARQILQEEIFRSNNEMISYLIGDIEQALLSVETSANQFTANADVTSFISSKLRIDRYSTVTLTNSIAGMASTMVDTNSQIKGVRIYSIRNQMRISETGTHFLTDTDAESIKELFETYPQKSWIEGGKAILPEQPADNIRLLYLIHTYYRQPGGLLVVELDTSRFFGNILHRSSPSGVNIAVLNAEGEAIAASSPGMPQALYAYVGGAENIAVSCQGVDYLVSSRHSDMTGWNYIIAVPEGSVTDKIVHMRNQILLISALTLIVVLAGCYGISRKLYSPIRSIGELLTQNGEPQTSLEQLPNASRDEYGQINRKIQSILAELAVAQGIQEQMEKENSELQSSLDESSELLAQYFLYQVLMGDIRSEEELRRRGSFLGFRYDRPYIAVLVNFYSSFSKCMKPMDKKEQEGFQSGVLEILSNTLPQETEPMRLFFENISDDSATVWAILACPDSYETETLLYKLKVSLGFFQNILLNRFEIESIIGIGNICENLSGLFDSGEQAKDVLRYRFVFGYNTVITKEELTEGQNSPVNYYYYKKHLKKCLIHCDRQEISQLIRSHLEMLRDKGILIADYQYYCKDLINILCEFFSEIGMRDSEAVHELTDRFIHFDQYFHSFEDTAQWLSEYVQKVLGTQGTVCYSKVISQAVGIIEMEYNTDLSLSSLAERLSVSTPYLSSLFKEEVGQNFKEYLTAVKLSKARSLLITTSESINEIAEKVGYNNAKQFSAIFKKYVGSTPAEYRRDNL